MSIHDSPSSDSITASIRAAQAGGGDGFSDLFERSAPRIRAYARLRGVDDPDALTNDALFDAFRQIDRFEGDAAAWETFVFQIARNKIIDDHRRQSRRPQRTNEDLDDRPDAETVAGTAPSSEDLAVSHLGLGDLSAHLGELTTEQREVVILRFVLDLSILQVAEVLDKPETAIKALQRRALGALRKSLDEGVSQ